MTGAITGIMTAWRTCWHALRTLSGDDAYERYLQHHATAHPESPVLSRRAFYVDEQQRKWGSINRCC